MLEITPNSLVGGIKIRKALTTYSLPIQASDAYNGSSKSCKQEMSGKVSLSWILGLISKSWGLESFQGIEIMFITPKTGEV